MHSAAAFSQGGHDRRRRGSGGRGGSARDDRARGDDAYLSTSYLDYELNAVRSPLGPGRVNAGNRRGAQSKRSDSLRDNYRYDSYADPHGRESGGRDSGGYGRDGYGRDGYRRGRGEVRDSREAGLATHHRPNARRERDAGRTERSELSERSEVIRSESLRGGYGAGRGSAGYRRDVNVSGGNGNADPELCNHYTVYGTCKYGSDCHYLHKIVNVCSVPDAHIGGTFTATMAALAPALPVVADPLVAAAAAGALPGAIPGVLPQHLLPAVTPPPLPSFELYTSGRTDKCVKRWIIAPIPSEANTAAHAAGSMVNGIGAPGAGTGPDVLFAQDAVAAQQPIGSGGAATTRSAIGSGITNYSCTLDATTPFDTQVTKIFLAADCLFCGLHDGRIKGFHRTSGATFELIGHAREVHAIALLENILISADFSGNVRFWKPALTQTQSVTFECAQVFEAGFPVLVLAPYFAQDGSRSLWMGGHGKLALLNLQTMQFVAQHAPSDQGLLMDFVKYDSHLWSASHLGSFLAVNPLTGALAGSFGQASPKRILAVTGTDTVQDGPALLLGHPEGEVTCLQMPQLKSKSHQSHVSLLTGRRWRRIRSEKLWSASMRNVRISALKLGSSLDANSNSSLSLGLGLLGLGMRSEMEVAMRIVRSANAMKDVRKTLKAEAPSGGRHKRVQLQSKPSGASYEWTVRLLSILLHSTFNKSRRSRYCCPSLASADKRQKRFALQTSTPCQMPSHTPHSSIFASVTCISLRNDGWTPTRDDTCVPLTSTPHTPTHTVTHTSAVSPSGTMRLCSGKCEIDTDEILSCLSQHYGLTSFTATRCAKSSPPIRRLTSLLQLPMTAILEFGRSRTDPQSGRRPPQGRKIETPRHRAGERPPEGTDAAREDTLEYANRFYYCENYMSAKDTKIYKNVYINQNQFHLLCVYILQPSLFCSFAPVRLHL